MANQKRKISLADVQWADVQWKDPLFPQLK